MIELKKCIYRALGLKYLRPLTIDDLVGRDYNDVSERLIQALKECQETNKIVKVYTQSYKL